MSTKMMRMGMMILALRSMVVRVQAERVHLQDNLTPFGTPLATHMQLFRLLYGISGSVLPVFPADKKGEGRSRIDRDADTHQLMQLEEKDVVSSVATVLSDLCGPGEWMPMEKLHSEFLEQYSSVWHHSHVRRYLTSEDYPGAEAKGKPWFGLLMSLRKYPEHFVINTRSKGRVTLDFVSLVSLLS